MGTDEILKLVAKERILAGHPVVCPNVSFLFLWEYDVLSVSKSGYVYEHEVKISRSDFFADKKKGKAEKYICPPYSQTPNYFFYVVPEGLVSAEEVPAYAGLYYAIDGKLTLIKEAKLLHKQKHDKAKIEAKVLKLYQQRYALGCTMLTYNNRLIKSAFEEHEIWRKEQAMKVINHRKNNQP